MQATYYQPELTEYQEIVLKLLRERCEIDGYSPSVQELQTMLKIAPMRMQSLLGELVAGGFVAVRNECVEVTGSDVK